MAVDGKTKKIEKSAENRFIKFFREMKAETKRITWASKKDTKKAITAVFIFCVIYIVLVALMDYGFDNLFKLIFK